MTQSYLYFECSHEKLNTILEFLTEPKPDNSGENSKLSLTVSSGVCRFRWGNQDREEVSVDYITFVAMSDRIVIETYGGENPLIPYYETEHGNRAQDRNNLKKVREFSDRLLESIAKEMDVDEELNSKSIQLYDTELSERCISKFERGEYVDAVATGLKILEERVRENAGEDLSDYYGKDLMMQAFNPDDGPLAFGENKNEKQGVMFLYAGAIQALRNPLHHRTPKEDGPRHLDGFSEPDAQSILKFVDFLLSEI